MVKNHSNGTGEAKLSLASYFLCYSNGGTFIDFSHFQTAIFLVLKITILFEYFSLA